MKRNKHFQFTNGISNGQKHICVCPNHKVFQLTWMRGNECMLNNITKWICLYILDKQVQEMKLANFAENMSCCLWWPFVIQFQTNYANIWDSGYFVFCYAYILYLYVRTVSNGTPNETHLNITSKCFQLSVKQPPLSIDTRNSCVEYLEWNLNEPLILCINNVLDSRFTICKCIESSVLCSHKSIAT